MEGLRAKGSSGAVSKMYVRQPNGQIELVEPQANDEILPAQGHYDIIQVTGIGEVFTLPSRFTNDDGSPKPDQDMRRWQFTIRRGKNLNGRKFSVILPDHYTAKNASGRLIEGIRGYPPQPGEDLELEAFIGNATDKRGAFSASIEHTDQGKPKIGTIDLPETAPTNGNGAAVAATPPPAAPAPAPVAAPVAAAEPDPWGEANPFTGN
jgi:hypothetical protein